jgi:IS5 family transposase
LAATRNYIDTVGELLQRAIDSIRPYRSGSEWYEHIVEQIMYFRGHGKTLIEQIERRCFKDQTIAHEEKIFSLFEPHTEWIVKGKAGISQELGLRVAIVECTQGFVLHHQVMEQETDEQIAVEIIKETKAQFKNLRSCSFDKGFHSPENQQKLSAILDFCVLPKKGNLDKTQRERETAPRFKELRRKHAAVESAINALENHGLDRVLDYGIDGFKRYVALSIVARNIQLLGRMLQARQLEALQRERTVRRLAA